MTAEVDKPDISMVVSSEGSAQRDLQAVLWDLDGTLLDSEALWTAGKAEVARSLRVDWSDADAQWSEGRPTRAYSRRMADRAGLHTEFEVGMMISTAVARRIRASPVPRPGAIVLVRRLRAEGYRSALVTMADRAVADAAQDALGHRFDVIVAGDDVTESKPHPEPYLRALDALRLTADACVAVEDSERGVASAEAAGLAVVYVPSMPDSIVSRPDRRVFNSLEDVSIAMMTDVLARKRSERAG